MNMTSFYRVFILLTIATVSTQKQQSCPVVFVSKTNDDKPRLTMLQEGNYTIQALIQLSEKTDCQKKISRSGLIQMYAVQYAIERFNSNRSFSNYATVGLQIDDVCGELPTTMSRGIEIVSFHREKSVCRSDFLKCDRQNPRVSTLAKRASAVIGTAFSFTSIPLSSLMSLYDITQVSPSATSRLLSKKDLYKSFFRTIPSDTNQISVMIDIFKKFEWHYIFAVGSDDDYGKLAINQLQTNTSGTKICIVKDEYIPYQSQNTEYRINDVIQKIKDEPNAKVVVLFLYVDGIGDQILRRAHEEGIERIWLTSEAWNPVALDTFNQPQYKDLVNQTHGILSVSLKRYRLNHLYKFMKHEITNNYECNKWLQQYIFNTYGCQIDKYDSVKKSFNCSDSSIGNLPLKDVLDDLEINQPGSLSNLIDAATSLCHAIYSVIKQDCREPSSCNKIELKTTDVTEAMERVNFINEQKQHISFINGDPAIASYTIENLVLSNGVLKYVQVGDWSANVLKLDEKNIQWPLWFNESKTKPTGSYPSSVCSEKCQPGSKTIGDGLCCWDCHKCTGNTYSDKPMQRECHECGNYKHTLNNIHCIVTPINWLKIDDSTGMSIVVVSAVGFLVTFFATIFICKYRNLVCIHDNSPHMMTIICIILFLTFIYGPLHVLKPTNNLCQVRNSYFFVLLMIYGSFVLVKTQAMTNYLRGHAERSFGGKLLAPQLIVLLLFLLLEAVSVVAWLNVDGLQVKEFRKLEQHIIFMQCEVEFTAARLVSTFIPCIILIIATFCAFRERNADHSFYEPKFLSFACIALCIIIIAFLPTFRYVVGIYKAIVLAFTMNVFGYTFMACLIFPKVYVGVVRKRRGINEYPMKPGTNKRKKQKKDNKKKEATGGGIVESTVIESSKTKNAVNGSELTEGIDMSYTNSDVANEEKICVNGLNNGKQPAIETERNENKVFSNINGATSPETTNV